MMHYSINVAVGQKICFFGDAMAGCYTLYSRVASLIDLSL